MAFFRSQAEYSIDSKGRLAIPAKMRALLGEQKTLVALYGLDPCLHLSPLDTWQAKEIDLVRSVNHFNPEHRAALRRITMQTEDLELDAQGRVTLTKLLLDKGGLAGSATARILGSGDHMEIWDPAALEAHLNRPSGESEELIERTFGGL